MKVHITKCKINVKENEEEVLRFLHSFNILERGNILSPEKSIWFQFYHYIRLHSYYTGAKEPQLFYTYVTKSEKLYGEILPDITFEELQEYRPLFEKNYGANIG